jgi:hypothetical protein
MPRKQRFKPSRKPKPIDTPNDAQQAAPPRDTIIPATEPMPAEQSEH